MIDQDMIDQDMIDQDITDLRRGLWVLTQAKMTLITRHQRSAVMVVKWLHGRGNFYYNNELREFQGVLYFDSKRKTLIQVQSDDFQAWLSDALTINRADTLFKFIMSACETEGLSDRSNAIELASYWKATDTAFYLSNGPGQIVKITSQGVIQVDNGTDGVLFPYGATLKPWQITETIDPFEACQLFNDMNASVNHARLLFKIWAISLPSNQINKPIMCITGDVGSGKTRVLTGIFELYGLPHSVNKVQKQGEIDFWVSVNRGGMAIFDNVDTKIDWLADTLAAASTGGCLERRKLYTNNEYISLNARSWTSVTSVNPSYASDVGLSDRLIVIRLHRRDGITSDGALSNEIQTNRDAGLSWICQTLSKALEQQGAVPEGLNQRHPDFGRLAYRIGQAIGKESETITALQSNELDKSILSLENSPVGAALWELMQSGSGEFNGTAGELLERLKGIDPAIVGNANRPLSVKGLSKIILSLWPHLVKIFHAQRVEIPGKPNIYTLKNEYSDYQTLIPINSRENNITSRNTKTAFHTNYTKLPEEIYNQKWKESDQDARCRIINLTCVDHLCKLEDVHSVIECDWDELGPGKRGAIIEYYKSKDSRGVTYER
jgi:hypothetical protein